MQIFKNIIGFALGMFGILAVAVGISDFVNGAFGDAIGILFLMGLVPCAGSYFLLKDLIKPKLSQNKEQINVENTPAPDFFLKYQDAKGELSERNITVQKLYAKDSTSKIIYMDC